MARIRINIQITDSLLEKLDECSENLNLSRSAYISMALSKYIQQEQMLDILPEMMKLAREQQAKEIEELLEKEDKFEV